MDTYIELEIPKQSIIEKSTKIEEKNGLPKILWTKTISWMHTAKYMGYHSIRINGTLVSYKERCFYRRFDIE